MGAVSGEGEQVRCVVEGCEGQGMRATPGCKKGAYRCIAHNGLSCWGGWRGCDCMLMQKGRQRGRVKGPVRGLEGIRCRAQRSEWDRRDGLCERVMAGESLLMRVRLGLDTVIARVEWLVHGEPHTADGGGGPWSRVNEVHVHDGEEEVSVILDRVQWDILEVGDPEYPLESPDVSENEGVDDEEEGWGEESRGAVLPPDELGVIEGILTGVGEATGPGTPCIGEHSGRGVDEDEYPVSPGVLSVDVAPTETPVLGPQKDVFVTLWE